MFLRRRSSPTTRTALPIYVAIPVYNGGRTIKHTLDNLLCQTHEEYRVIIYDDGSTDNTGEIIRDAALADSRITIISGTKNQGRGAARNCLLEAAHGGIIAWQDADDTWRPTKLAEQLAFYQQLPSRGFDQNRCVVLSTFDRTVIKDGLGVFTTHVPPTIYDIPYVLGDSYGNCPFQLQATFGLASVYADAGGFDSKLNWSEDLDIVLKILTSGGAVAPHQSELGLAKYYHSLRSVNGDVVLASQKIIANRYRKVASEQGIDIDDLYRRRRLNYLFNIYLENGDFSKAIYTTLSSVMEGDDQKLRTASRNLVAVFRAMLEAHASGDQSAIP
jgi:glycosyltransferase involved in cell wall biosynthesis